MTTSVRMPGRVCGNSPVVRSPVLRRRFPFADSVMVPARRPLVPSSVDCPLWITLQSPSILRQQAAALTVRPRRLAVPPGSAVWPAGRLLDDGFPPLGINFVSASYRSRCSSGPDAQWAPGAPGPCVMLEIQRAGTGYACPPPWGRPAACRVAAGGPPLFRREHRHQAARIVRPESSCADPFRAGALAASCRFAPDRMHR